MKHDDMVIRIPGTDRLRCLDCYEEFDDDPQGEADHEHAHRRLLEGKRKRGLPVSDSDAKWFRVKGIAYDGPCPPEERARRAFYTIAADYWSFAHDLLRGGDLRIEDLDTFQWFASKIIDAHPGLESIRGELMSLVARHPWSCKCSKLRRRQARQDAREEAANTIPTISLEDLIAQEYRARQKSIIAPVKLPTPTYT